MYIDSGADVSMIPLEFGKALGFEKKEDDGIYEVKGVLGGVFRTSLRKLLWFSMIKEWK